MRRMALTLAAVLLLAAAGCLLVVGLAVRDASQPLAAAVTLPDSATLVRQLVWSACLRAAGWLALLAVVTAVAIAAILRTWQRSLRDVAAQARALGQGRPLQAPANGYVELQQLTDSLNAAVMRLREAQALQARDVSRLQRRSQLDDVTGLPLRNYFLGNLQRRLGDAGESPVALLLVRVLHLDTLNQRLGHSATDVVLGTLADVLLTYVERAPGTFAGRLNGSDFALCLPVRGLAQETADSLRAALSGVPALGGGGAEAVVGGVEGLLGVPCGSALAAADAALARAETEGRAAIDQAGDLVGDPLGARAWREQIAGALSQGRIRLAGLPVRDRDGSLLHLECTLQVQLVAGGDYEDAQRWLALARRSRLLPQLDVAAVRLALQAIAGDGVPRAIHASLMSLAAPGLIEEVRQRLAAAPAAARQLAVEWREGPRPPDAAARTAMAGAVALWQPLGARTGVEHAGGSAEQLPALRQSGIDYVKLGGRHLGAVAGDATARGYAQGLLQLLHGLGFQVLAEDVDDEADLAMLWSLGLDGLRVGDEVPKPD